MNVSNCVRLVESVFYVLDEVLPVGFVVVCVCSVMLC